MSSSPGTPPGPGTGDWVALYWIPLGAGGNGFVRFNGRIYESTKARFERRPPRDLFHTALEVSVEGERFVIENAWPSPDAHTESRGVVFEGPVFSKRLGRFRPFRYEVRCWPDGIIADRDEAVVVAVPTRDRLEARRLIDLVAKVPAMTWGRDEQDAGEMWNSNSVVAWLLAKSDLATRGVEPPSGGRAPGWVAGLRAGRDADLAERAERKSTVGGDQPDAT